MMHTSIDLSIPIKHRWRGTSGLGHRLGRPQVAVLRKKWRKSLTPLGASRQGRAGFGAITGRIAQIGGYFGVPDLLIQDHPDAPGAQAARRRANDTTNHFLERVSFDDESKDQSTPRECGRICGAEC